MCNSSLCSVSFLNQIFFLYPSNRVGTWSFTVIELRMHESEKHSKKKSRRVGISNINFGNAEITNTHEYMKASCR